MDGDLSQSLRAWRSRQHPRDAGLLVAEEGRRASGLRRQELADLAAISVDYVIRLEQGRARHPSGQVVQRLAQALDLSADEREHLSLLAGLAPAPMTVFPTDLPLSLHRLVRRLGDVPIQVIDPAWTILYRNRAGAALLGDVNELPQDSRNIAWRQFTGLPSPFVRDQTETESFEREIVADLRRATARFPADRELANLIARLRSISDRFDRLWDQHVIESAPPMRKTVLHSSVGEITLDCDVLTTERGLRVVIYSAEPASPDALALRRVCNRELSLERGYDGRVGRPELFTEKAILDATLHIIGREGIGSATVTNVAEALGAPSGSIYHRFASRDELVARLWVRTVREFQVGFLQALDEPDVEDGARAAILHTPTWTVEHPTEARLLLRYRHEDLIAHWPDTVGLDEAHLNAPVANALKAFTRRRFETVAPTTLRGVRFALVDIPYSAARSHILGESPFTPTGKDLLVAASTAVLAQLGHALRPPLHTGLRVRGVASDR